MPAFALNIAGVIVGLGIRADVPAWDSSAELDLMRYRDLPNVMWQILAARTNSPPVKVALRAMRTGGQITIELRTLSKLRPATGCSLAVSIIE
jgi:hypothetical protein